MMADSPRPVTGGVDTHKDEHVAAVLDGVGVVLGTASFPNRAIGHMELGRWLASFGPLGRVGVEGTGSYGAGLARYLRGIGVEVVDQRRPLQTRDHPMPQALHRPPSIPTPPSHHARPNTMSDTVTLTATQANELAGVLAALMHWLIFASSAGRAELTRSLRAHGLQYDGPFDTPDPVEDLTNLIDAYHTILSPWPDNNRNPDAKIQI